MLNLQRNNLQRKHLSIWGKHGPVCLPQRRLELFFLWSFSFLRSSCLSSTSSLLTYGPYKAKSARRVCFHASLETAKNKWALLFGPPYWLFIPAWNSCTSNQKEPQGTIQTSSRHWLVNQKMNKKWTKRKTSQELWGGQEVGFQAPDSSKYISNRCENNEKRSSEDRFVETPNLLVFPEAEQEMLRIWGRLGLECFFQLQSHDRNALTTSRRGENKRMSVA